MPRLCREGSQGLIYEAVERALWPLLARNFLAESERYKAARGIAVQNLRPSKSPLSPNSPATTAKRLNSGVELDELGPMKWSPNDASNWELPDSAGRGVGLESFRWKPVIVMFYLGSGCAQCIEQLNAFAPMAEEYARARIALVAISTDTVGGLKETAALASEAGGFPVPR